MNDRPILCDKLCHNSPATGGSMDAKCLESVKYILFKLSWRSMNINELNK